ncbi:MAG: hypothetical protein HYU41_04735 [Candidatus Rokubacteria bacterium]|nr:hypothetical protein [Candidatus Rokubacteria bacterium]
MSPFRQLIHGRVDRADHQRLKAEAAARGISMSKCVGDVVREYFALRAEMTSVSRSPGVPGDGHPGLVHSLVARMEERLGTRADTRADELSEGQRRLESILDRFGMLYLLHTLEVPRELHDAAVVSANRRYDEHEREAPCRHHAAIVSERIPTTSSRPLDCRARAAYDAPR